MIVIAGIHIMDKLAPGRFYGQTQRSLHVGGFMFAESVYSANLDIPVHAHVNAFLYFVIEGEYEETCGRETRSGGPSALVFHPAGEPHANRWLGPGGRVLHIDISRDRADAIREYGPRLDRPVDLRGGVAPWLAGRLFREYRRPDGASSLAMEGLVLEILAELGRHPLPAAGRTPPRWLRRARELLHDRFAEKPSIGEIAEAVGVHPVHLARVFRREHGCTPGEYVRRLRIEFACRQLASSDSPLVQVALSAGFPDQSHFTKAFRHQMRMTPGEFRQQFRALR
jgi:AraC family transcriptional regulator